PGRLRGEAVDSNPSLAPEEASVECRRGDTLRCPENAWDGRPLSIWGSECSPCRQGQAWTGQVYRNPQTVRCIWIKQSQHSHHRTANVRLDSWDGQNWVQKAMLVDIAGGTWDHAPRAISAGWRVLGVATTDKPWAVDALSFFSDAGCANE
ncbi:unnamed protein product, partial [Polarella glacialis]